MAKKNTPARQFTITVRPKAAEDLEAIWDYVARDTPIHADSLLDRLDAAMESLQSMPRRCAVARESEAFGFDIRQRLVGHYRILFTIEGRKVRVLRVRSSWQAFLSPQDDPLIH